MLMLQTPDLYNHGQFSQTKAMNNFVPVDPMARTFGINPKLDALIPPVVKHFFITRSEDPT